MAKPRVPWKPFKYNGWGNSGMNECRKSIPTRELLQENHSLMFWQFGKFHIRTSAQKLSCYIFQYPTLIWQVFFVRFHNSKNACAHFEFYSKKIVKWKRYSAGNSISALVIKSFPLNITIWQIFLLFIFIFMRSWT